MRESKASIIKSEKGAVLILIAISIVVLIGMVALAFDVSHLVVAKNELQNAADAGALAGANYLYSADGLIINTDANQEGAIGATANQSENLAVEVSWSAGNAGDVLRGHWSFATKTFTPNASTVITDLWGKTDAELDADTNFINAVQVTAHRNDTPVVSYFARIFGIDGFEMKADAVAYIGFAGTLFPGEVDQPIAICEEALLIDDEYTCSVGRFINSGSNNATNESGGWTDFNQDSPCNGGTNAQLMKEVVCGDGNGDMVFLGDDMATTGGQIQTAFDRLLDCWKNFSLPANEPPTGPWNMKLPVIRCNGNNPGPCNEVVGAVNVNVMWITEGGEDPQYNNIPEEMACDSCGTDPLLSSVSWSQTANCGAFDLGTKEGKEDCWESFATAFSLLNKDGEPAPYSKKNIFFLPDCTPHDLAGRSGGENFGVLAKIPVLVE